MDTSFRGRFECKVDPKGRLSLPSAFRNQMNAETPALVITNGLFKKKRCLDIYTHKQWHLLEEKINNMPALKSEVQAYQRFYLASGQGVQADGQSRVLIPAQLRKYAGIEEEVVLVGMGKKLELWPASTWRELHEDMASNFEDILSTVAELEGA